MKFSYSAVWDDTLRLLRAHGSLIAALAGVFIFLPALLTGHFLPAPQAESVQRLGELMVEYAQANWHWILLGTLVEMLGAIAILRLVFPRGPSTVGGVIAAALPLLPFYFLASLMSSVIVGIGLLALLIPGLYLAGRLAPVGPVVVAEDRRNPIDAIRRTLEVTKGNGWAVFGLVLVVALAGTIVAVVINNLLGLLLILIAGREVGLFLTLIVGSATSAALAALLTLLYAAIYRALVPAESARVQ